MSELRVVGQRVPPIDAWDKSTGRTRFASDVRVPGMLCGKVLRSPHPHARVLRVDVQKAERMHGVKAVITAADGPGVKYGQIVADELPLAADRVRFVGDAVAAVAAIDEATAAEALHLIEVDYEELPAVFDPRAALAEGAPIIHEHSANNVVVQYKISRGDVEEAFRSADFVLEGRFTTSVVHQGYLEPVVCIAEFDPRGRLTEWVPIQSPHSLRNLLSKALSMPVEHIRVIQTPVGGGFGGKNEHRIEVICALLAKKAGRPVRMANSYKEELTCGLPRVPMNIDLKMGARRDGTLVAKEAKIVADNGAYTSLAPAVLSVAAMRVDTLYRFSNVKTEATLVYTNKVPTGMFRGFGNPQMTFAVESLMDMLAERAGIDPVDIRLRNAMQTGGLSPHGYIVRSCGLSECIKSAAAEAGWREKRAENKIGRGVGIACCTHASSNRGALPMFDGSSALVKIGDDGMVRVISGETDTGQGARTVFAQIAAQELGIGLDQVSVEGVDTDLSPYGIGSVSSRVTMLGGNAVKAAATDARQQILQVAAGLLEANPADLALDNGRIYVRGALDRAASFREVVRAGVFQKGGAPIVGQGVYLPDNVVIPDAKTKYGNISAAYTFAAHVAEVEVDLQTGEVSVVNFTASHDVGKAINPLGVEGQIEGGVSQGIGYALTENLVFQNGEVQNSHFGDYLLPTAIDGTNVRSILIETIDPVGPYGAKGVGEPSLVPVAAAVANAIYDATGVRLTSLPMTAEDIQQALIPTVQG